MIQPTPRRGPGGPAPTPGAEPRRRQGEPYPDIRGALMLTILAMLTAALVGVFFIELGTLAAVGIGQAIGVGAVATMAARRVAEPQAERLGLRGLEAHALPLVLCLTPAILLASELDNFAVDWSGGPEAPSYVEREISGDDEGGSVQTPAARLPPSAEESVSGIEGGGAEGTDDTPQDEGAREDRGADEVSEELAGPLIDPEDPWSLLQAFVIFVGIAPVVEEFLFRGVIQQGLLARLGLVRGIGTVALLWTLLRPAPVDTLGRFVAAAVASFGLGCALGIVRVATGSILGSILLASLWGAVGLGVIALEGRLDLPGLNVQGTHLPWTVSIASAAVVGWAAWTLYLEAERRFATEGTSGRDGSTKGHGGASPTGPPDSMDG